MDCTLYDMETKRPIIFFDTLKTSEIEVTSDKVYAQGGKGNSKLVTWEINKEAKLTIEDALISPKSIELVTGMATKVGAKAIAMRQANTYKNGVDQGSTYPLTASATGVIELAQTPVEAAADILVYAADDDCGTPLEMTSASLSGKTLTVSDAKNKKVVVYYTYMSNEKTETYTVDSTKFSGTYKLIGDTVIRNSETGKDEAFQVVIPNLKFSSNLTLGFSAKKLAS